MKETQETRSLGREDPLEKGMATHSSILAWRIPMHRGAWQATVHGVTNSQTWLTMPTAATDRYMMERKIIDLDKLWASFPKDNCLFPYWLATAAGILSPPSNPLVSALGQVVHYVAALLGDEHPSGLQCSPASGAGLHQLSGHGVSGAHTVLSWPSPAQIILPGSSSRVFSHRADRAPRRAMTGQKIIKGTRDKLLQGDLGPLTLSPEFPLSLESLHSVSSPLGHVAPISPTVDIDKAPPKQA